MYWVDLDFLLALLKEDDIWTETAQEIYQEHGAVAVNQYTLVEFLLVARRFHLDLETGLFTIQRRFQVHADMQFFLAVAYLIETHDMTVFDALNAQIALEDGIISSDKIYDTAGIFRVKMEERRKQ